MPHFFFKIIPPRPTFAQDMTAEERGLMMQHAAYAKDLFDKGQLLAYGPVLDPGGSFGIGLLEMNSLEEAERMAKDDPSVKAGLNTYTLAPMHIAASQPSRVTK